MSSSIPPLSPTPSTSSQHLSSNTGNEAISTLETVLLTSNLISLSSKHITESTLRNRLNLTLDSMETVRVTSCQISDIARETSKSAAEVAQAIILCNINLKSRLTSNITLDPQETDLIKMILTDIDSQPSTSRAALEGTSNLGTLLIKTPDYQQQTQSEGEPPAKKQKIAEQEKVLEALYHEKEPLKCSDEMLSALLQHLHNDALQKPTTPFLCPLGHKKEVCHECSPIKALLSTSSQPTSPAWQIKTLCCYTTPERLVQSLQRNKSILTTLLLGNYLKNHQLVVLIEDCHIDASIYSARYRFPGILANFYATADKLISEVESSRILKAVLDVWSDPHCIPASPMQNTLVKDGDRIISHNDASLACLVPKTSRYLERVQQVQESQTGYVNHQMTGNIAKYVAKITITTVQALLRRLENATLFTKTSSGMVLETSQIEQLFAIILLSIKRWHFFGPICKASVQYLSQELTFQEPLKGQLCLALDNFCTKNALYLPGVHLS